VFALSVVDGRGKLTLAATPAETTEPRGAWALIEALELDLPGLDLPPDAAALPLPIGQFQSRRSVLRRATLRTDPERLQSALSRCPLAAFGITGLRVWLDASGVRLGGRAASGGREAPFALRVGVNPRCQGKRRLRITLGDVRIFGHLPLPAPLLGSALAAAIAAGARKQGASLRLAGYALDIDPLELALIPALVAAGWRLPDIGICQIDRSLGRDGENVLRLGFGDAGDGEGGAAIDGGGDGSAATAGESDARPPPLATVEGESLPDTLRTAEDRLLAGAIAMAEEAYRRALAREPDNLTARARLLALRSAQAGHDAVALAASVTERWPEFVPGWLYAAIAASEHREHSRAAALFARAAVAAEARGEVEDARLARAAALVELRVQPLAEAPDDELALRADLAEQNNDWESAREAISEVGRRSRLDGDRGLRRDGEPAAARLGRLAAAVYTSEGDRTVRAAAIASLLTEIEALPAEEQTPAFGAIAEAAEIHQDLALAEQTYWRAAQGARDPSVRAGFLVAHARVLLAQGDDAAAIPELEQALTTSPGHAGALALMADQAFHSSDWARARQIYAELDRAGVPADVIPRDLLLSRRGAMAHDAGDLPEAEICYQELAAADPTGLESRQRLADIALARQDLPAAAARMEEVIQLLPREAVDTLLDAHEKLGEIYLGLGDWGTARRYLEEVLAQDPVRLQTLEQLVTVRGRLGLHAEAADLCARLSRLYDDPRRRAQALYQQGEILREHLGDDEGAFEAYLKSSDLDPRFAPTALRLVAGFWGRGNFAEAAAVGEELRRAGPLPLVDPRLRARLALALALARQDPDRALTVAELRGIPCDLEAAADVICEAGELLRARSPIELEPAVVVLERWGRTRALAATLADVLDARAADAPAPGLLRVLGWLADRAGDAARARVRYAMAVFVDENDGVVARLEQLGAPPAPSAQTLALAGNADHPGAVGAAAPLRRALAALARALGGLGPLRARRLPVADRGLPPARAAALHALGDMLKAPARRLVTTDQRTPDGDVLAIPTRPAILEIPDTLAAVTPDPELAFLVARSFDHLRNGMALVEAVTRDPAHDLVGLLAGTRAALIGAPPSGSPLARAATEALADAERRWALLTGVSREQLLEDLSSARAVAGSSWDAFSEAAELAGDRFAALACGSPLAALTALFRIEALRPSDEPHLMAHERRLRFLRTPRVQALVDFLLQPGAGAATAHRPVGGG
jgi:Tfp pilus assembly protein PilF